MAEVGVQSLGSAHVTPDLDHPSFVVILQVSISLMMFGMFMATVHWLILLLWRCVLNRKYYRHQQEEARLRRLSNAMGMNKRALALRGKKRRRGPSFRPLPEALVWPNLEISVLLIYATGLVEAASAIIGAGIGGLEISTWRLAFAYACLAFLLWFILSQALELFRFYRECGEACWAPEEPPATADEVTDPLLRLLAKLHLMRPRLREQGSFEAPEDEGVAEPQRTEQELTRGLLLGLSWCRGRPKRQSCFDRLPAAIHASLPGRCRASRSIPGGSTAAEAKLPTSRRMELLPTWLGNASGSRAGIGFVIVQVRMVAVPASKFTHSASYLTVH